MWNNHSQIKVYRGFYTSFQYESSKFHSSNTVKLKNKVIWISSGHYWCDFALCYYYCNFLFLLSRHHLLDCNEVCNYKIYRDQPDVWLARVVHMRIVIIVGRGKGDSQTFGYYKPPFSFSLHTPLVKKFTQTLPTWKDR